MDYVAQIKNADGAWVTVRPMLRGELRVQPYRWSTIEHAEHFLRVFYPDAARTPGVTRVVAHR